MSPQSYHQVRIDSFARQSDPPRAHTHARARARAHPARLRRPRRPHLAVAPAAYLPLQERLEALLVAAYDEIKADLSGDAARRERLEAHCERLELESRMAWQSLRRIAGVCRGAARTLD